MVDAVGAVFRLTLWLVVVCGLLWFVVVVGNTGVFYTPKKKIDYRKHYYGIEF